MTTASARGHRAPHAPIGAGPTARRAASWSQFARAAARRSAHGVNNVHGIAWPNDRDDGSRVTRTRLEALDEGGMLARMQQRTRMASCVLAVTLAACRGGDSGTDDGEGDGGDTGNPGMFDCDDCDPVPACVCSCVDPLTGVPVEQFGECTNSPNTAQCLSDCETLWALYGGCPEPAEGNCWNIECNVCSTAPDSGSCSGWSPASQISLVSGVAVGDRQPSAPLDMR